MNVLLLGLMLGAQGGFTAPISDDELGKAAVAIQVAKVQLSRIAVPIPTIVPTIMPTQSYQAVQSGGCVGGNCQVSSRQLLFPRLRR